MSLEKIEELSIEELLSLDGNKANVKVRGHIKGLFHSVSADGRHFSYNGLLYCDIHNLSDSKYPLLVRRQVPNTDPFEVSALIIAEKDRQEVCLQGFYRKDGTSSTTKPVLLIQALKTSNYESPIFHIVMGIHGPKY